MHSFQDKIEKLTISILILFSPHQLARVVQFHPSGQNLGQPVLISQAELTFVRKYPLEFLVFRAFFPSLTTSCLWTRYTGNNTPQRSGRNDIRIRAAEGFNSFNGKASVNQRTWQQSGMDADTTSVHPELVQKEIYGTKTIMRLQGISIWPENLNKRYMNTFVVQIILLLIIFRFDSFYKASVMIKAGFCLIELMETVRGIHFLTHLAYNGNYRNNLQF